MPVANPSLDEALDTHLKRAFIDTRYVASPYKIKVDQRLPERVDAGCMET
jgi:hypothetical protein